MAYRSSHYRKGHFRTNKNGTISWVSPSIVSGYTYEPGTQSESNKGYVGNIQYYNNGIKQSDPLDGFEHKDILEEIARLFRQLDSEERKYCLDVLDAIDTEIDSSLFETMERDDSREEDDIESIVELIENTDNTLTVNKYIGFGDEEIISIPMQHNGKVITSIAASAFENCKSLRKIVLPDSISELGNRAFYGCRKLEVVEFSATLISIGAFAFATSGLREVILPNSVREIGLGCFEYNKSLERVVLSENIGKISSCAFRECTYLEEVIFPKKLKIIESQAFSHCYELKHIYLHDGLQKIRYGAFDSVSYKKPTRRIRVPESVNEFDDLDSFSCVFGEKPYNTTIMCKQGSYVQEYARKKGIKCERDI